MAGNVWEWTHTPWAENHDPPRSTERADAGKHFTIKGGYYVGNRTLVRCAARDGDFPDLRSVNLYYGLRVLLSPRVQ
jgi:formylglycine-generating enzyme required for sulfatase activity